MKKKIKNNTILGILTLLFFLFLQKNTVVMESARLALHIWKHNIFPALFPTFILSDLMLNYGVINILQFFIYKPFQKFFHFTKEEFYLFFISMIGGFPSSGKYTSLFYQKNYIHLESANRMIMCSHFSNPLFIFGTIHSFLSNKKTCLLILLSHYLGNFVLAFYTKRKKIESPYRRKETKQVSFSDCLTTSITTNTKTLLFILGTITIFYILSSFLSLILPSSSFLFAFISGLLEITQGVFRISTLNISFSLKGLITTFFLSFGGFCIHIQTIGMLQHTKIKYSKFLKGRMIHSTLSVLFYIILNELSN